jgi:hypothetical protein
MTDRCSSDVWIAQDYNAGPLEGSGILLIRQGNTYAYSDWMPVNGHSWIRWWCHSTTGNWADPGTWRIDGLSTKIQCNSDGDCSVVGGSISISFSSRGGWTAERSRCDSSSTRYIRARLGPDRLLRMQCIRP